MLQSTHSPVSINGRHAQILARGWGGPGWWGAGGEGRKTELRVGFDV